jgi:ATP-binding cassette subfamily E protein 1
MPPKEQSTITRIAIINPDRCKPKKCSQECKKVCPINYQGKLCIEVEPTSTLAQISEELCVGCALCQKRCPFKAITILNIPSNLNTQIIHRYGRNGFKLHGLPLPRPGQILGLVGANGTGKTTALKILAGKLIMNLGKENPDPKEIKNRFNGTELQKYFDLLNSGYIRVNIKPQYIADSQNCQSSVREILLKNNELNKMDYYIEQLDLIHILDRTISKLSGGEMQRVWIAINCNKRGNMFIFDEPTSYLDIKQRIKISNIIREMANDQNYVVCVEHDLAILDYLSDQVCLLYGKPSVYGVVTMPHSCTEGINIFLNGFEPTENMRFREESLNFRFSENVEEMKRNTVVKYPKMNIKNGNFSLDIESGEVSDSEIIIILGENGCGKTTFVKLLAGVLKLEGVDVPQMAVSYKPQMINPRFEGSVKDLLQTKINSALNDSQFKIDVINPMAIEELYELDVQNLSGGELQRVAIVLTLGTPANIYLLDEPSAFLDSDQRIIASKVIKKFIMNTKKTAFIIEHDFIMATYLADRIIVFEGTPAMNCQASLPMDLTTGVNRFLRNLGITMRRDPSNYRPRINKPGSVKDQEQKEKGMYLEEIRDT